MSEPGNARGGIDDLEQADAIFGALAHPARRQILLSVHIRREATAGEIASRFQCSWPTVSRHLGVLSGVGLLEVRRCGRQRVYQCNAGLLSAVLTQWARYFDESASSGAVSPGAS